jgi:hypothetical protein
MSTTAITPYQVELLHHTLGLSERRRESFRNYFVAGEGHHDMHDLEALERAGLMERRATPGFLHAGDIVFAATDAGRDQAISALPEPREPTRYEDFLAHDGCCGSFGEYLTNGRVPKFEQRSAYGRAPRDRYGYEYRMYRTDVWPREYRRDVEGDWCASKKDAKASYKAVLKRRHAQQRAALRGAAQ